MKKETRDIMMKKAAKAREDSFAMECGRALADYIMEDTNESNDFYNHPSNNHVYYKACVVQMGKVYAEKILTDAKADLVEDDEEHYDEYW